MWGLTVDLDHDRVRDQSVAGLLTVTSLSTRSRVDQVKRGMRLRGCRIESGVVWSRQDQVRGGSIGLERGIWG